MEFDKLGFEEELNELSLKYPNIAIFLGRLERVIR
ncbi:hypothetical protein LCGC14_0694400 [marine sediment metagenome]|uniref:Uncharacterized protein n=1 Tax=marine sediment metagenome TaxID=412755 RepID=A0A0F9TSJ2_9ZZZZ